MSDDGQDVTPLEAMDGGGNPFDPGPQQFETTYTITLPRRGTTSEDPITITQKILSGTTGNTVEVSVEPTNLDGVEYDAVMQVLMEMI